MSAPWLALLLAAGPLDDLAPLRAEARVPELTLTDAAPTLERGRCKLTRRTVADARVTNHWVMECPVESAALVVEPKAGVAAAELFTQTGTSTIVAVSKREAAVFDEYTGGAPAWVPASVVAAFQKRRAQNSPMQLIVTDPRSGAMLKHGYDRGYVWEKPSPTGPEQRPVWKSPPESTPFRAAWFGAEETPWFFYAPDPWHRLELRLRSPNGEEQVLFERPARPNGGNYRLTDLSAVQPGGHPVFSMIAEGRHLVLWPEAGGKFSARVQGVSWPGERPARLGNPVPPCSDETRAVVDAQVLSPKLFEFQGRAWVAVLSRETRLTWRLGAVPSLGATPKDDAATCDWIADARVPRAFLVLSRFSATGQLEEVLRVPVPSASAGLTLDVQGSLLTTGVTGYGALTLSQFDLAKLSR